MDVVADKGAVWPPVRIVSQRLLLRAPVYDDGPALNAFLSDPEVCRFLPYKPSISLDFTHHIIGMWASVVDKGITTYVICLNTAVQQPFGVVQIQKNVTSNDIELGVVLSSQAWGNGYAREAFAMIRKSAPPGAALRLWGGVDAANTRAIAMLSKIGLAPPKVAEACRIHPALSPDPRTCVVFERNLPYSE